MDAKTISMIGLILSMAIPVGLLIALFIKAKSAKADKTN